jgi:hypothetical protein
MSLSARRSLPASEADVAQAAEAGSKCGAAKQRGAAAATLRLLLLAAKLLLLLAETLAVAGREWLELRVSREHTRQGARTHT